MIIDDEYTGMKEKYYEQAQTKIGVLSGVVKGLNEFVKKYDSAKQTMNSDIREIKNTWKKCVNIKNFLLNIMEI